MASAPSSRSPFNSASTPPSAQDLVNHCVNDIAVQGAEPLFFLDYLATGKLEHKVIEKVVSGLAKACKENGCALIGGETAQMPGFYADGEYDLAGFIVGVVDRDKLITGKDIKRRRRSHRSAFHRPAHQRLLARPQAHLRNCWPQAGRSRARSQRKGRRGADEDPPQLPAGHPTTHAARMVAGMAHITGGGITENLPRILPKDISAEIETGSWPVPPLFAICGSSGNVPQDEMLRTFNMGIGLIAVIPQAKWKRAQSLLGRARRKVPRHRPVVKGDRSVHYLRMSTRLRLGILLSGRGSNFLAIADSVRAGRIPNAEIAIVISNKADASGSGRRARTAACMRSPSKLTAASAPNTTPTIIAALREHRVDLICLAGYMRLLSPGFIAGLSGAHSEYPSIAAPRLSRP